MKKLELSINERFACSILSHLKYNKNNQFVKCIKNDFLLSLAKFVLGGIDPVDFMDFVLSRTIDNYDEERSIADIDILRK